MDAKRINPELYELAKKGKVIRCEECGNDYFHPVFVLVKVDKLESGLSTDKVVPLQAFKCAQCGHINRSMDPLSDELAE